MVKVGAIVGAALVAIGAKVGLDKVTEVHLPAHLLHHKSVFIPELFDETTQKELLELLKRKKDIPSNSADLSFYTTKHEHIGEAQPIGADGKCEHPYLIPNMNHTLCVLPGRIDIARFFAMTGGYNGLKENLGSLFSRLQSFGLYLFDLESNDHAVIRKLFASPAFKDAATQICPKDKQYLDRFQLNYIINVPGQAVATHLDGVYFRHASRFTFPQWLLAVMAFSGLFQDEFIDQVQIVGYASDWASGMVEQNPFKYGEFVFWNDEAMVDHKMAPLPRSGNAVDGSKTVHTTTIYRPDVRPPFLDKNKKNMLQYQEETDSWNLMSDDEVLQTYNTSDLRISIVYRARCFESEEEAQKFQNSFKDYSQMMQLEQVLDKLVNHAEKVLGRKAPTDRLSLALFLLDTYVKYPFPKKTSWIPFNYCALFKSYDNPIC